MANALTYYCVSLAFIVDAIFLQNIHFQRTKFFKLTFITIFRVSNVSKNKVNSNWDLHLIKENVDRVMRKTSNYFEDSKVRLLIKQQIIFFYFLTTEIYL